MPGKKLRDRQYDVCLSFAGEDRAPAKRLASYLTERGVRVFYDEYAKAELWGKDLYSHLDDIYRNAARYCVMFVSKNYAKKVWTNHERQSAQARAIKNHAEYVLPVRIDNTDLPGIRDTLGYIDLKKTTISEIADLISKKLGPRQRGNFFPPYPDQLFEMLRAKSVKKQKEVLEAAYSFFDALKRMNKTERRLVAEIFLSGCPSELPENIHISLDLLRRMTGVGPTKAVRTLSKLGSLGFQWELRKSHDGISDDPTVALEWHDLRVHNTRSLTDSNSTHIASAMFGLAAEGLCENCVQEALDTLDFGQLASFTKVSEVH
jgi:hypothetical protein